jgi:hypothetical protein
LRPIAHVGSESRQVFRPDTVVGVNGSFQQTTVGIYLLAIEINGLNEALNCSTYSLEAIWDIHSW